MSEMIRPERRSSRPLIPVHDTTAGTIELVRRLGYTFRDPGLLEASLTHPSWRNEHPEATTDNQRHEFLGDAVLGLVITEALLERLPDRREGQLTVLKSQLVRESSLAEQALPLGIGLALRLGRGEDYTGGRRRTSVLADAFEAVVGAVFVDGGYLAARELVLRLFDDLLDAAAVAVAELGATPTALSAGVANWKTAVQELLQQNGNLPPIYTVLEEQGPFHARIFVVQASSRVGTGDDEAELVGIGRGPSKKLAEHAAASDLYQSVLNHEHNSDPTLAALAHQPSSRPSGLRPRASVAAEAAKADDDDCNGAAP